MTTNTTHPTAAAWRYLADTALLHVSDLYCKLQYSQALRLDLYCGLQYHIELDGKVR